MIRHVDDTDENGNRVYQLGQDDSRFRVFLLARESGRGYITDARLGGVWPGLCLTWFGQRERYPTWRAALAALAADGKDEWIASWIS